MTNIQLLFFSSIFVVMIVAQFVILYKMNKIGSRINDVNTEIEALKSSNKKALDFCNTLFDKLKEIVNKVNPLLEAAPDNTEVHEAQIKEEE